MIADTGGLFLEALAYEEQALNDTAKKKAEVEAAYYIASRKYATARDTAISHFGDDPYVKGFTKREELEKLANARGFKLGRYRFIHRPIGVAILYALYEAETGLTLSDIIITLRDGGHTNATGRAVNAALINLRSVNQTQDGRYWYEPTDADLPPWLEESAVWDHERGR